MKDNITELAKLFKARENKIVPAFTTGIVLAPLPDIKIKLNEQIILGKSNLLISERVFAQTLIVGDEVLLIPSNDEQTYYLSDKVRRLT